MTRHVLGVRADLAQTARQIHAQNRQGGGLVSTTPTAFVVAPQPSGLEWCLGRLSFADDHAVDVSWNVTTEQAEGTQAVASEVFMLHLDLSHARSVSQGRVELPLRFGPRLLHSAPEDQKIQIEIEIDGEVVANITRSAVEEMAVAGGTDRYTFLLPTPLHSSHMFFVRRRYASM